MASISSLFGYILNFIYEFIQNYGFSIIIFSVLLKLLLLPLSIRQQKSMRKTAIIQEKVKEIQEKYKNDQNKMNQEVMELYKKERPSMGCSSLIIQTIILFAIFTLVRSPLTYMKKIDERKIDYLKYYMKKQEISINERYPQISILEYVSKNRDKITIDKKEIRDFYFEKANESYVNLIKLANKEENSEIKEKILEEISKEENSDNNIVEINLEELYINTNFLSMDLSNVPLENLQNPKVYIIPVLYVITSIVSMKITTNSTKTKNKKEEQESENSKNSEKTEQEQMSEQMGKSMTWFMPVMSISISLVAPLGLALYWLINNILMTAERLVLNKILDSKEGDEQKDE